MSLEDKVHGKESEGFIKKTLKMGFNLALAGTATAFGVATFGTMVPIIGGAFALGSTIGSLSQGKPVYDTALDAVKNYTVLNAALPFLLTAWDATIPLIPNDTLVGKAMRGLYASTVFNAGFEAMFKGARHLIDNYGNPSGITKSIKNNFYNDWKRSAVGFSPAYTLAANGFAHLGALGLPPIIPTFAYNAFALPLYNSFYPAGKKASGHAPSYAPAHAAGH